MSLAHSILQMKNKENVFLLKQKAYAVYEKLAVLAFVEEYVNSTPNSQETKQELTSKVEKAFEIKDFISEEVEEIEEVKPDAIIHQLEDEKSFEVEIEDDFSNEETIIAKSVADIIETLAEEKQVVAPIQEEVQEEIKEELEEKLSVEEELLVGEDLKSETETEQPFDDLENIIFGEAEPTSIKEEPKDVGERKVLTLEEELEDTISVDVIADLFASAKPTSLNNKLQTNIQIGLNDRIIFVKNLFEGSQEDFNRVISQLNTFKTEKEAKKFMTKMVKPDYNWSNHEDLELRLMDIIERRFA